MQNLLRISHGGKSANISESERDKTVPNEIKKYGPDSEILEEKGVRRVGTKILISYISKKFRI
jgi:hypothetical protein